VHSHRVRVSSGNLEPSRRRGVVETPSTVASFEQRLAKGRPKAGTRHFENCIASTKSQSILYNPSYKGLTVDALALGADEGRGRLR
jgi:hypothetical protein